MLHDAQALAPRGRPTRESHLAAARRLLVGRRPRPARPTSRRRLRVSIGWTVDAVAFEVIEHLFVTGHRKNLAGRTDYERLAGGWLELCEAAMQQPLELFFPRPPAPPVTATRLKTLGDGGVVEEIHFSSRGYAPQRETAQRMLARYPENATVHLRCHRHPGSGHPAVVWLHGWGMGSPRVEAALARTRQLYDLGLDVYLYVQPHHGPRRASGSGLLHPSTHLTRTNEAFLQTAWEVRAILGLHRQRGGGAGGVMGWSLGGYVAAMLASVAPELAFAVAMLPMADVPALLWSHGEGTADRLHAEQRGVTFEDFCRAMAVHAPLAHRLLLPAERVLLVGGEADAIIPPVHTNALREHWGGVRLHWFPGGHLLHFGRGRTFRRVADFLREIGVCRTR
jgi:pimeloyl-ACP methyl ester carboxylesterase